MIKTKYYWKLILYEENVILGMVMGKFIIKRFFCNKLKCKEKIR